MVDSLKNEFKNVFNNKVNVFVLLIAPLLVNLLLGWVFQTEQIKNIPIAVMDGDNSYLSRTITQEFGDNEVFDIKCFVESEEKLKELFNSSQIRCALVIPKDFSKDVKGLKKPSVLMIYDGSNMSITSAAKAKATEILLTYKIGTSMKIMAGKLNLTVDESQKIAQSVAFRNRYLYNPTKSFKNFINPGFGAAIVQTCIALIAAAAIRRKEIQALRIDRVGYLGGKVLFYSIIGTLNFTLSSVIQHFIFKVPFRGSLVTVMILGLFMSFAVSSFALLVSAWIENKMISVTVNAVIFIPSTVLAGYTWPVLSMPSFYQKLAYFLPFYHYGDNIRDIMIKGKTMSEVMPDLLWFAIFTFTTLILGFLGIMIMRTHSSSFEDGSEVGLEV